MAVVVKTYKSAKQLKQSLKKSASEGSWLKYVSEDGMLVRFLTEPEEWLEFQEVFNTQENRSEIITEDWVRPPGLDRNPTKRFAASVLDRESGEVVGLKMPATLVSSLFVFYEKYGTIMDRDYDLLREGKGMDTTYHSIPEAPERIRGIEKYEPLDLLEILERMANPDGYDDDEEDEDDLMEDEEESKPKHRSPGKNRRRSDIEDTPPWEEDEDDEDEDDEEDDEDVKPVKPRRSVRNMKARRSRRGR